MFLRTHHMLCTKVSASHLRQVLIDLRVQLLLRKLDFPIRVLFLPLLRLLRLFAAGPLGFAAI